MAGQELLELSRQLQMDLRAAQRKLIELQAMIVALNLPDRPRFSCPDCKGLEFRGPLALAEHRYHQHGDPEPLHWLEAEKLASDSAQ